MTDRAQRRQLRDEARRHPPDAGVYAVRHRATGRVLVAAAVNLAGARNRFEFEVSTNTLGALDGQLGGDIRTHGVEGLEFEVLETVHVEPGASEADLRAELKILEAMWREQLAPGRGG